MPILGSQGSTKGPSTAPTIGTATAGNASASVTFTAPSFSKLPITSYTVTSSPGSFTGTGASSPITVSGLTNGTPYTFTVTATNANGTSAASSASNSVSPALSWSAWTLTELDAGSGKNVSNVMYGGGGTFYAQMYNVPGSPAGNYGQATGYTSTNGTSWTARTLPSAQQYRNPLYTSSIWVIPTDGTYYITSPDAATWTARTYTGRNAWNSCAGAGTFAVGGYGGNGCNTSTDGINWTDRTMADSSAWAAAVYGAGLHVHLTASSGTLYNTSPDGITWTSRSTFPVTGSWYNGGWNGSVLLVASVGTSTYATSTNGTSWTQRTLPIPSAPEAQVYSPTGGQFTIGTNGSTTVYSSPDGVTWTARNLPSNTLGGMRASMGGPNKMITPTNYNSVASITFS